MGADGGRLLLRSRVATAQRLRPGLRGGLCDRSGDHDTQPSRRVVLLRARTLIAFFPLAFVLLVILVAPVTRRIHRAVGIFSALAIGGIVEMADLVRHSEGLLAFGAILLACLFVKAPLWKRTAALLIVVLGSSLVMHAVPMSVQLFNDVRTGRYEGRLLPYLQPVRPSYHAGWHTLLISLGRYPNPEGLYYNNLTGVTKVRLAYPDLAKTQEGELESAPRAC